MIDLDHLEPFASGANRDCFRHPTTPRRCLKVLRPGSIEARSCKQPGWKKLRGRQYLDDNWQERRGYGQSAIHKLIKDGRAELVWQHLPEFHGMAITSRGPANETELIVDHDGRPAPTLEQYLTLQGLDNEIQPAIARFCSWLKSTGILTRNLLPHNLVITSRGGQPELFLVDGLGAPWVPDHLAVLPQWRQRYIERRIARFHKRLHWEAAGRTTDWESEQKL